MAVQLFGAKPEELAPATRELTRMGWRRVDLNMGCPVKKVVKTGGGAALMRDPALAEACISAMRAEIQGVFTVKIRLGWDASNQNCLEIAQLAARCGADGVILHGRTRAQGYGGVADWTRVRELSGALGIPLAGNGDIADPQTALERLRECGVAAVMIGRAGVSSPWIFRDMHRLAQGEAPLGHPSPEAVAEDLLEQFGDLAAEKGERRAVAEMKKFVAWSAKGFPGVGEVRRQVMSVKDAAEMKAAIGALARFEEQFRNGEPLEAA
jgi:nifR3 family TIM-barrel protein